MSKVKVKEVVREILRIIVKVILRIFVTILFFVKKVGEENIPKEGACIVCPNHISNWDPLIMEVCTKRSLRMMAKIELFKNPILKALAFIFKIFPVKRGEGDVEAIKNALRVLKNKEVLCLYPEGTRKGMEKGIKPKNGAVLIAIKAGVPIIPVGIQGEFKLFRQMKINYGKPIYYNKDEINVQDKEHIDKLTKDLMDNIVLLRDEKL